jgi:acetyl esterase/lipase
MPSFAARTARWSILPMIRSRIASTMWSSPNPRPELDKLRAQSTSFAKRSPTHTVPRDRFELLDIPKRIAAEVHLHKPRAQSSASALTNSHTVVFGLHGGAFVLGSPALYRPMWRALSEAAQCTVVAPMYPLAPEASMLQMTESVECAYRALIDQITLTGVAADDVPRRIVVLGDSAGGHLLATLLLRLQHTSPQLKPRAAIFSSPILSFATRWSNAASSIEDPLLPFENNALQALAGFLNTGFNCFHRDADAKQVELRAKIIEHCNTSTVMSPLDNTVDKLMSALPANIYVSCGSLEGLRPQIEHFVSLARTKSKANVTFNVRDGMWHSFPLAASQVSEGAAEIEQWAQFIKSTSAR